MSEYTTRQILDMIAEKDHMGGVDLSGKDLRGIDLSVHALHAELARLPAHGAHAFTKSRSDAGFNLLNANLEGADLTNANLEGAMLQGVNLKYACLLSAKLQGATLMGAVLAGAILSSANLEEANLLNADLEDAHLQGASLRGALLYDAHLQGADLSRTNLEGTALANANLAGAFLAKANLHGVDMLWVRGMSDSHLWGAQLSSTQMSKDQFHGTILEERARRWFRAKETYLSLKADFEQLGRYADASWAYCRERRMEKLHTWQEMWEAILKAQWHLALRKASRVAADHIVELICDYGESVWRVIISLLVVWVAFAAIYGVFASVLGPWQETATKVVRHTTRNPLHLLAFSLGTMTTLSPPELDPSPNLLMQILMPVQAMLGIVLAGLLGFVLGNRIRRS